MLRWCWNGMAEKNDSIIYADMLRIIAIVAVIILHSAGPLLREFNSVELNWWLTALLFDSATRWCVPIFVMISGLLLLNPSKNESIKNFISKRFNKVLVPFIFWGFIYTILKYRAEIIENQTLPILKMVGNFVIGPMNHLWFIYMLLGLYLLTPILRIYIKNSNQNDLKYFLILWLIANGVFGFIESISKIKIGLNLDFFYGFIGYYILGHYLNTVPLNKKQIQLAYIVAIISLFVTILGTFTLTKSNGGNYSGIFHGYLSPNIIFMSTGIFIAFKNYDWDGKFKNQGYMYNKMLELSSLSFGIYLIHILILNLISFKFMPIKITAMLINPLFGIPFTALVTLVISYLAMKCLRRVPLLKQFIG